MVASRCRHVAAVRGLHVAAAAAAAGVYAFLVLQYLQGGFVEDSFIHFRYADNLAHGHGLAWNPGQGPVEGFTSLTWVLALAAAAHLSGASVPDVGFALGILFGGGILLCYWLVARRCLPPGSDVAALIVPLHLAVSPVVARHAISGFETSLTIVLMGTLALVWASRGGLPRTALLSAAATVLLALTRPDALLFAVAGTTAFVFAARSPDAARVYWVSFVLPLGVALAAYLAWKLWYFGGVIPLPALMKIAPQEIYSSPPLLRFVFSQWFEFLAYAAPVVFLAMIGLWSGATPRQSALIALAAGTAAHAVYLLTVVPEMAFHWRFFYPVLPSLSVLAVAGLWHVLRRDENSSRRFQLQTVALVGFFVLYNLGHWGQIRRQTLEDTLDTQVLVDLGRALEGIGAIEIAGSDAGAIPFFSRAAFVDLEGLNDPVAAGIRAQEGDRSLLLEEYLLERPALPDVFITHSAEPGFARLDRLPTVRQAYTLAVTMPTRSAEPYDIFILKTSPYSQAILDRLLPLSVESMPVRVP